MPPNDGGADGAEVHNTVVASTKLKFHMNEVLNVLVSQKTSDYEATMQAESQGYRDSSASWRTDGRVPSELAAPFGSESSLSPGTSEFTETVLCVVNAF
ncbi:hypothetical protein F444_19884 [Phytophthora nicotianae P1976]|uniref:Uncharacterized protein n=1 Tax=Phytophthora nicotianae P1976 TaxID=1317066 RepID=A0A080Z6C6_PHYNI|nr:hypothetical protein F444_19884 [Phytophthora nicotianae P1976]